MKYRICQEADADAAIRWFYNWHLIDGDSDKKEKNDIRIFTYITKIGKAWREACQGQMSAFSRLARGVSSTV
jgi:hypothetical protein